jgi:hypothetical protein
VRIEQAARVVGLILPVVALIWWARWLRARGRWTWIPVAVLAWLSVGVVVQQLHVERWESFGARLAFVVVMGLVLIVGFVYLVRGLFGLSDALRRRGNPLWPAPYTFALALVLVPVSRILPDDVLRIALIALLVVVVLTAVSSAWTWWSQRSGAGPRGGPGSGSSPSPSSWG